MASFIKRRGMVQVKIRKRGYPTVSRTFHDEREARLWATQTELAMERDEWVDEDHVEEVAVRRLTIAQALDKFYAEYIQRRREDPRPEYLRIQRLKKTSLAEYRLTTLRKRHVAAYVQNREREVGPDTIRLELALLSKMYSFAVSAWSLESLANPVKGVIKPTPSPGRERRLDLGEAGAMIAELSDGHDLVMCWALETAMRRAEIARLEWRDIDIAKRRAIVRRSKNGTRRAVPLSRGAVAVLEFVAHRTGSVFRVSADSISQHWARARDALGIKDLHFHDLRHESISRLFERTDLDMLEIKAISGHKTTAMLARYTHLRAANLADRLDGVPRGHVARAGDHSAPKLQASERQATVEPVIH